VQRTKQPAQPQIFQEKIDGRHYDKEVVPGHDRTRVGDRDHPAGMGFQLYASKRIQIVHSIIAGSGCSGEIIPTPSQQHRVPSITVDLRHLIAVVEKIGAVLLQ
jgi:hypothetical protein